MAGINTPRLLIGGILAGLLINISEFVLNGVVLMDDMEAAMAGTDMAFAPWAMPFYVFMAFLWGFALVALYAAVRPRLGAGPRTAITVGLAFWVIAAVLPTVSFAAMGLGGGMIGITLAWTAVEMPAAAFVGAWAYQEGEETVVAPAVPR